MTRILASFGNIFGLIQFVGLTDAPPRSIMTGMDDAAWKALTWKQRARHPRTLAAIFGALVAGVVFGAVGWYVSIRPALRVEKMRYESTLDIAKLYGLQLSYKKAHGVYADSLDALLHDAPDRDALRADLILNVDTTTIAVVGDAEKFKIELNVLDAERSSIKVKGPVQPRADAKAPAAMPEPEQPMNSAGAPVSGR